MKFIKGFIVGTVFGVAVGSTISEQQRREVASKAAAATKRRLRPVSDAFADRARDVVDDAVAVAVS